MKKTILGVLVLMLISSLAQAQTGQESKGHGYIYFAPGISAPESEGAMHIGGGGEGFFNRYLGAGAEVGYVAPYSSFSDGIGIFSPNVVARFRPKSKENKVEPFVTGGYSLFFRSRSTNGANVGGGVNWWFKERLGLRFEVRDNFAVLDDGDTVHLVGFRFGLTFK